MYYNNIKFNDQFTGIYYGELFFHPPNATFYYESKQRFIHQQRQIIHQLRQQNAAKMSRCYQINNGYEIYDKLYEDKMARFIEIMNVENDGDKNEDEMRTDSEETLSEELLMEPPKLDSIDDKILNITKKRKKNNTKR